MSTTTVRGAADLRVDGAPSERLSGVGPAGAWALTADVLVRRATLPVSALSALRSEVLRQVNRLSEERSRLEEAGRVLAVELYPAIGAQRDGSARGALVGARRALHTARPLSPSETDSLRLLPDRLRQLVTTWHGDLTDLVSGETALGPRLAAELATDTSRLLDSARSPEFRHALSLAAGSLVTELDKLDRDPRRRLKTAKKVRLVKFVARAATKASPYSSFLSTCAEPWTDVTGRPVGGTVGGEAVAPRLTRQLDQGWVDQLTARLADEAARRGTAHVRTNPSLCAGDGALLLLRGERQEPAVLPDHPVVRRWVALVDDLAAAGPGPDLTQVRSAAQRTGLDPDDVDRLVGAGLLELCLPVDDVDPEPLAALRDWLRSTGEPWAAREAERLDPLVEALRRAGPMDDGRSHRDLVALADRLVASHSTTHQDQADPPESSVPPRGAERVHEVLVGASPGRGPRLAEWRSTMDDLDVARRWLSLFSWKHPVRLVFGTWFGERFGSGATVPLTTAMATVRGQVSRPAGELGSTEHLLQLVLSPGAMPWFLDVAACPDRRLLELDRLRRQALAEVELVDPQWSDPDWSDADGTTHVRLDPTVLARQMAGLPSWVTGCPSAACYVQPVPGDPGSVVLNGMHLGLGRARSRHAGLLSRPVRHSDRGAGPMAAELAGHFGSSMNARVATFPFVIDAPGAVSTRDRAERLAPGGLELRHDPATDLVRLWSPAHEREVVPYHVGMMGEMGLSPLATFLDRVLSPSFVVHASVSLLGAASLPGLVGMRREPRVSVGSVVVQRARTTLPADQVPVGTGGRIGVAELLALARWRRERGIPEVCFTRAWSADQHSLDHKGRKPLLVDFQNCYSVEAFAAQVRDADVVVVEEAYPDLLGASDGDPRLTELVIEIGDADQPVGGTP